jgi:hypothetical protein
VCVRNRAPNYALPDSLKIVTIFETMSSTEVEELSKTIIEYGNSIKQAKQEGKLKGRVIGIDVGCQGEV